MRTARWRYEAAKAMLFDWLGLRHAVNLDDAAGPCWRALWRGVSPRPARKAMLMTPAR
jgi:hypothetical protein